MFVSAIVVITVLLIIWTNDRRKYTDSATVVDSIIARIDERFSEEEPTIGQVVIVNVGKGNKKFEMGTVQGCDLHRSESNNDDTTRLTGTVDVVYYDQPSKVHTVAYENCEFFNKV